MPNFTCTCPNGYGGNPYDGVCLFFFFLLFVYCQIFIDFFLSAPISTNASWATPAELEASAPTRTAATNALARLDSAATPKSLASTSTNAHRRLPASNRLQFAAAAPSAITCPELLDASARQDSRATPKSLVKVQRKKKHFSILIFNNKRKKKEKRIFKK